MYLAVSGSDAGEERREDRGLAPPAPRRPRSRRTRRRPRGASAAVRIGVVAGLGQDVGDREAQVGVAVVGLAEGRRGHAGQLRDGRRDRRPAEAGRALVGLRERAAGQEDGRDRQLVGRQGSGGSRRAGRSSRRSGWSPRRARPARSSGACRGWYTVPGRWLTGRGSRSRCTGIPGGPPPARAREPGRLPALVRGPRDRPPGALPGSPDADRGDRAVLHRAGASDPRRWRWRSTSAPRTGSSARAPSASSTRDNGSALYHITIGEKDAWGKGYGTEATQLMLDHAFGTMGLHRIALFVFEFNERAMRAYRRCGFVIEGRARESIWRDGRWWDELAMSVLESDWRKRRRRGRGAAAATDGPGAPAARPRTPATVSVRPVSPGPSGRPTASGARSGGCGDDRERGRRRRAGRGPRADRGQGTCRRQRAGRGRPPGGGIRRGRPGADRPP